MTECTGQQETRWEQSIAVELVHASHITLQKYKVINRVNYTATDSTPQIDLRASDPSTS
jgi:hypothetical protein